MKSRCVTGLRITNKPCMLAIVVFLVLPFGLTQHSDEHYIVEPTPALRLGEDDLTTVLLVNNDNRTEAHGRFLNVRPTVGLLTSTARTFIQEGVTTEYATQVLGTTLENGRLYAQLLKKSSRVLYDKENTITASAVSGGGVVHTSIVGEGPHYHLFAQPRSLLESHNDLVGDKDWQDVDDRIILKKNSFVGNTDYVGSIPRASQVVFPVKPVTGSNSIVLREDVGTFNEKSSSSRSSISSEAFRIKANKVQPAVDLPTFTVKNVFSPSGFSWDSPPLEAERQQTIETHSQVSVSEQRSPKLLYHQVLKDEHRQLATVTYYGFAEFTTVVGDSVIVFSPSTSSDQVSLGHVTSIRGEATLGRQDTSYVSNVAITITQDLIEPTFVVPMLSTDVKDLQVKPKDMRVKSEGELTRFQPPVQVEAEIEVTTVPQEPPKPVEVLSSDVQSAPKDQTYINAIEEHTTLPPIIEENVSTTLQPPAQEDEVTPEVVAAHEYEEEEEEIVLASSMSDIEAGATVLTPQPSPVETVAPVLLSRPSDEEILRIYSSLARAEAAKKASEMTQVSQAAIAFETTTQGTTELTTETNQTTDEQPTTTPTVPTSEEPIQPDFKIQGGATTIFYEDDPFLDFVSPSSTETSALEATQIHIQTSVNTESTVSTTSEAPEEENTEPPQERDTESVTEEMPATEPNIEATTTVPESESADEAKEEKKEDNKSDSVFKPIIKEIGENEQVEGCIRTSQVFLTQIPKTLTYYTTFFVPNEEKHDETSTSIETNIVPSFDIEQATKHYCIQPTQVVTTLHATEVPVLQRSEEANALEKLPEATTPMMVVRENAEVTESSDIDASGAGYEDEEDEEDDDEDQVSGEEIELIYKTLYTTYTYLTTFFHDSTTSVSSRKEVVTNIITSSLGMESMRPSEGAGIEPTASVGVEVTSTVSLGIGRPTAKFVVQPSDLVKVDDILQEDSVAAALKPTAQLDDNKIAKTYYTTYTYYTTIFVDGETEVMSRTEVHTNLVGKATDIGTSHSARNLNIDDTVFEEDNAVIDIRPTASYDTIQRTAIVSGEIKQESMQIESQLKYKTLNRGLQELESSSSSSSSRTEKKIVAIEDDSVKMVTDMRSSSSNGDHHLIENGVLEDQISSESNTDEILPSATLLLQTSFTTFTYYTTMYSSDATNVISRLETVTNVVTETLQPTKTLNVAEATLPITYFTTFTYWTKLAKDGEITTLSREETVSNVVTPTLTDSSSVATSIAERPVFVSESSAVELASPSAQLEATTLTGLEPTTYYTTYTYYTTSYAGDQTITDSRFETVTNVVIPSSVTSAVPASSLSVVNEEITKNNESVLEAIPAQVKPLEPPKTLSYDYKTIVDAEGISTLYFKTELLATIVDGSSTEIASSTSTINIDEVKKALSTTNLPEGSESTRTYKTGLVRLIEGTKLANHTTTIYQSKVIGTIIDERYAQIIESTSSFIIENTQEPGLDGIAQISATATVSPTSVQPTAFVAASSSKAIESSIGDVAEQEAEQDEEEDENDSEEEDDESGRPRTRLSFQTKKKTFTPVIRPFASRNRPQFAPKRKNLLPSSATIITRSDLTPTITATPAIKSESRGRFSSSRKANSGQSSSSVSGSSVQSGKRFGRPSKSSQFGGSSSSSRFSGSSRNSLQSSRAQGPSSSFGGFASSRRSGVPFRGGSSTNTRSFSSAYAGNSRLKIKPSSSLPYDSAPNTAGYTTLPPDSGEEEGITQKYDSEEETDVTTENLRRNNNPLLRFRRPPVSRPPFQPGQRANSPANAVSGRRNPLTPKPRITTSTSTTTTTSRPRPRAFQRPAIGGVQNRSRPQSNLFPPRRLFQPQNQALDEEQKTGDDFPDNEEEESDSAEYENDDEGGEDEQDAVNRRRRESLSKRIQGKKRSKRQANTFRNRFRRPSTAKPAAAEDKEDPPEENPSTVRSRASSRFAPRTHNLPTTTHTNSRPQTNGRAIRPTKPNSSSRAQFTLRESNTTPKLPSRPSSNFRRPLPNGSRRTTTAATRPKPARKAYGNTVTESSYHTSPRGKALNSRSRSTARARSRNDFVTDPAIPQFDGTITITHTSPTGITIPVVNGMVTEYKNVVTTTTRTEVILPNQYTSIIGQNGASTLILNREETAVNGNGATEVTQFVLHESPTTSVIFTPTTIRGRKTSFAHVIPSTAYQVENVVSTMQAQLAANAPLANILLSQLLLGNIGLNQGNLNPLLGLGATQAVTQNPGEPTTEFKVRSSTYVTTVTNGMSTVILLTFHGKEVMTTIFDSSSEVITATEYFTDTIVVTPTQQAQQQQQVNSLLLPLLLQQQLQQQPQQVLPIQNSIPPQNLLSDNLQDLDSNGIQKYNDYNNQNIDEYPNSHDELVEASQTTHTTRKSNGRKKPRKFNKQHSGAAHAPALESSVITLYVSGRRPGEFSTVLSTVQVGADSTLHKRQINRALPILKSDSFDDEDFYRSDGSEIQEYLLPANDIISSSQIINSNSLSEETQSLESIVGDVSLWYAKTSAQLGPANSDQSTAYDALLSSSSSAKLEETSLEDPALTSQSNYFLV